MKERPILIALIGYIIGILWGLYFSISIVFCYILCFAIYYIIKRNQKIHQTRKFRLISFRRYSRYIKLILPKKAIFILIVSSIIANGIVIFQNKKYDNAYPDGKDIQITGIVISQKIQKQYYDCYKIKVLNSKNFNLYIQIDKKSKELEYGDKIKIKGTYSKPEKRKNYGGYDDSNYLKTLKIVGRVKANQIEVVAKKQNHIMLQTVYEIRGKIENKIEKDFEKDKAELLKGLLLGETQEISKEVKQEFKIANISHILAISGIHISYLIIGVQFVFEKWIGKKNAKVVTSICLMVYAFLTGFSPSVIRAVTMAILVMGSKIVYRKSDVWNAISISLFAILLVHPYSILKVGLQLSYLGTIGILLFRTTILQIFSFIPAKTKIMQMVKEIIAVSLSAQIMIFPILIYHFNMVGIYFLLSNLLVSFIIGIVIIIGFLFIFLSFIFSPFVKIFVVPLNIGITFLKMISKISKLPFSKIYISTPSIFIICLYWVGILVGKYLYDMYHLEVLTSSHKRVKNLIALCYFKMKPKRKTYMIRMVIVLIILFGIHQIPKDLKIYFIDVGQGDCTFIVTPRNKTILIDGGGSLTDDFDVGKQIVVPYLLDRGYTTIDYIMLSHADQDHIGRNLKCYRRIKCKKCYPIQTRERYQTISKIYRISKAKRY